MNDDTLLILGMAVTMALAFGVPLFHALRG